MEGSIDSENGGGYLGWMNYLGSDSPKSTVAVFSGGLDSTVLLYAMLKQGIDVRGAITMNYGQKHSKEIEQAALICEKAGVQHQVADLRSIASLFGGSSLITGNEAIPEGHYEEDNMKSTVVPNRNMILISVAAAWAISKEAETIAYAAHSGDHAVYPDCREAFAQALDNAVQLCDWHPLHLFRPLVSISKADIVTLGVTVGAPMELSWSCYKGGALHCGCCGTCIERREAFYLAKVEDPTVYEETAPDLDLLVRKGWKLG